ncbi:MAG: M3 family metallopeptidase, partial [Pseudomonadota bacterium]
NDTVAKLLGFPNYAALELDGEIAKTPEHVDAFITGLIAKAQPRMAPFIQQLKNEMPNGMSLTSEGKFKPWDMKYLTTTYKKHHFNFNEHAATEYFPVEHTLQSIFDIFQTFLGIVFTPIKPAWAWHEDVQMLQVTDKQSGTLLGYLYLDLYPRDHKNGHAFLLDMVTGCTETMPDGSVHRTPAVGLLLANFPKASADRPALLKHEDVVTLCHELGHAMHFFIGKAELKSFSGLSVKYDFVETPSQLFELWPYDKECLKVITSHYKTGEPMPDDMIDTIIGMNKFENKTSLLGQCFYSQFSLKLFLGLIQNGYIETLEKQLETSIISHVMYDDKTHLYASFGHLVGYCSRYYCYLWSKVYSLALLDELKKGGLT